MLCSQKTVFMAVVSVVSQAFVQVRCIYATFIFERSSIHALWIAFFIHSTWPFTVPLAMDPFTSLGTHECVATDNNSAMGMILSFWAISLLIITWLADHSQITKPSRSFQNALREPVLVNAPCFHIIQSKEAHIIVLATDSDPQMTHPISCHASIAFASS